MSYTYKGQVYSFSTPIQSISVNKLKVVITDKMGSKLFTFNNREESKRFVANICQN